MDPAFLRSFDLRATCSSSQSSGRTSPDSHAELKRRSSTSLDEATARHRRWVLSMRESFEKRVSHASEGDPEWSDSEACDDERPPSRPQMRKRVSGYASSMSSSSPSSSAATCRARDGGEPSEPESRSSLREPFDPAEASLTELTEEVSDDSPFCPRLFLPPPLPALASACPRLFAPLPLHPHFDSDSPSGLRTLPRSRTPPTRTEATCSSLRWASPTPPPACLMPACPLPARRL
mmetsp:Transcript_28129/g.88170  ORF Transcript_28129/g.88170 Transcript_28129/m.88170 type:complete len:235 (+) Transcript_28129:59-763(+)